MRKLVIQLNYVRGLKPPTWWDNQFKQQLGQLGFNTLIYYRSIKKPPFGVRNLSNKRLHYLMVKNEDKSIRKYAREQGAWYARFLIVHSHKRDFLGSMFDFGGMPGGIDREGCAIYIDTIRSKVKNNKLFNVLMLRTSLHEMGHVLNFLHPIKPDNSVMTQTHVLSKHPLWPKNISYRYNAKDINFCRLNPNDRCRPGSGASFRGSTPNDVLELTKKRSSKKSLKIDIHVTQAFNGKVMLGSPIDLIVNITNKSKKSIKLKKPLGLSSDNIVLMIENCFTGQFSFFESPLISCGSKEDSMSLGPGRKINITEPIFLDRKGFVFEDSCGYKLYVALKTDRKLHYWYISNPLEIELISIDKSVNELAQHLFNREVGRYLYLQGAEHLTTPYKLVKKVIKMYPKSDHIAPLIESIANINYSKIFDNNLSTSNKRNRNKLQLSIDGFNKVLELEKSPIKCGQIAKKIVELNEKNGSKSEATKIMLDYSKQIEEFDELTSYTFMG